MRAFKVCYVESSEDVVVDMRVEICAAEDKTAAKDMFRHSDCRIVEVVDVTKTNCIALDVLRKVLTEYSSPFEHYDNDSIELLISLVKQCYENTCGR